MTERIEISLVGALTYGTLTKVFQVGESAMVDTQTWERLQKEVNPSTGEPMFCLTADLPPKVNPNAGDISTDDLSMSGLTGEIDTGIVVNTLDILNTPDGSDLSDLDEEPVTGDTSTTGDLTSDPQSPATGSEAPQTGDLTGSQASPDAAQSTVTAAAAAPKRLSIGGGTKSKAVQV